MDQVDHFFSFSVRQRKMEMLVLSDAVRWAFWANKKEWMKHIDDMGGKTEETVRLSTKEELLALKEWGKGKRR
jgi:hypothetical protein